MSRLTEDQHFVAHEDHGHDHTQHDDGFEHHPLDENGDFIGDEQFAEEPPFEEDLVAEPVTSYTPKKRGISKVYLFGGTAVALILGVFAWAAITGGTQQQQAAAKAQQQQAQLPPPKVQQPVAAQAQQTPVQQVQPQQASAAPLQGQSFGPLQFNAQPADDAQQTGATQPSEQQVEPEPRVESASKVIVDALKATADQQEAHLSRVDSVIEDIKNVLIKQDSRLAGIETRLAALESSKSAKADAAPKTEHRQTVRVTHPRVDRKAVTKKDVEPLNEEVAAAVAKVAAVPVNAAPVRQALIIRAVSGDRVWVSSGNSSATDSTTDINDYGVGQPIPGWGTVIAIDGASHHGYWRVVTDQGIAAEGRQLNLGEAE